MTPNHRPAPRSSVTRAAALIATLLIWMAVASPRSSTAASGVPLQVTAVDVVGFTVSDMDRALAFYTGVLGLSKVSDQEFSGRPFELLSGVFGARSRVVTLRLGSEQIGNNSTAVTSGGQK